jgi:Tfp pilus assembly major pilin PilA
MTERTTDRRREPGRSQAQRSPVHRSSNPVLALQRSIGNRAVAQVLARAAVRTGTVQISGVGEIKVKGGNLDEWAGKETPDTVVVTSAKGKHSPKLEKLSNAGTRTDVKVTIAPANDAGEQLSVGGGTLLEIKDARIKGYTIQGGEETWRVAEFENLHRTKITHKIS